MILILTVHETDKRHGRFDGFVTDYGQVCWSSRTPFLSAARTLIKRGLDPTTILVMVHEDTSTHSLRGTIGEAAKLIVEEADHAPRFRVARPRGVSTNHALNDDDPS